MNNGVGSKPGELCHQSLSNQNHVTSSSTLLETEVKKLQHGSKDHRKDGQDCDIATGMEERIITNLTTQIASKHAAIARHDQTI